MKIQCAVKITLCAGRPVMRRVAGAERPAEIRRPPLDGKAECWCRGHASTGNGKAAGDSAHLPRSLAPGVAQTEPMQACTGAWPRAGTEPDTWAQRPLVGPLGPVLFYKKTWYQYRNSRSKDKMVVRPSYLYNGNPHNSKMASIYCDRALITFRGWVILR